MPDQLLALSFLQPWLWAILERHKGFEFGGAYHAIENRKWKPWHLRERIALHASAGWDKAAVPFIADRLGGPERLPMLYSIPRGAIVGTARVFGAIDMKYEFERPLVDGHLPDRPIFGRDISAALVNRVLDSPWAFGPWCWVLADVRKLQEPVPCKGALGFWRVPEDVAALVREREAT